MVNSKMVNGPMIHLEPVEMNILIAHDEAFNFTYRANIDALRRMGKVSFFSPLHDTTPFSNLLPGAQRTTQDTQLLIYLPGGYPELFAEQLSANRSMRESIRKFAEQGGRIYAECGGFMYLTHDIDGMPMCDVFPIEATMHNAHLHLDYRQMTIGNTTVRGHEFHYSDIVPPQKMPDEIIVEQNQCSARGTHVPTAIYRYKNVVAGYTHWYWAEHPSTFGYILSPSK